MLPVDSGDEEFSSSSSSEKSASDDVNQSEATPKQKSAMSEPTPQSSHDSKLKEEIVTNKIMAAKSSLT